MSLLPGLCSVTFRRLPAEDIVRLASASSITAIEWGGDVHVPHGCVDEAREVAEMCAAEHIRCSSYGSYLFAGLVQGSDEIVAVLETARALAAPNVRVWCAGGGPDPDAGLRLEIVRQLGEICEQARSRDLTVSLEFHQNTLTETAASTLAVLREVDAPNLFTYWQPVGDAPSDRLLAELGNVLDDLSHVHVFHWGNGVRLPLADGAGMWPAALRAASAAGGRWEGQRVALLEFVQDDDPACFERDADTLRRWLSAVGEGAP
ncbi:MAG: hypothetical protein JJLCMIEE_00958 [Acidimicrobiales bacterium]|nr:hypothetical protein [Acidimicrobiales bacterium]